MDILSNNHKLKYDQEDLNKENTSISNSKSIISRRKYQKVIQELQISENLKKQADKLKVEYSFVSCEHVGMYMLK